MQRSARPKSLAALFRLVRASERASPGVIDRTIALAIQLAAAKVAAAAAAATAAATRRTRAAAPRSITRIRFPGSIADRIDRHRTERHDANKRHGIFPLEETGEAIKSEARRRCGKWRAWHAASRSRAIRAMIIIT